VWNRRTFEMMCGWSISVRVIAGIIDLVRKEGWAWKKFSPYSIEEPSSKVLLHASKSFGTRSSV